MFEKAFQILDCVSYCLTERCKRYSEKYTLTSYDNESLKKIQIMQLIKDGRIRKAIPNCPQIKVFWNKNTLKD